MQDDVEKLPPARLRPSLEELVDAIGTAATLRLIDGLGGTEDWYIPKKPTAGHRFVNVIGMAAFAKLCAALGPARIDLPASAYAKPKKAQILSETGGNQAVALRVGVTQRYVRKVRNAARARPRHPDLFD